MLIKITKFMFLIFIALILAYFLRKIFAPNVTSGVTFEVPALKEVNQGEVFLFRVRPTGISDPINTVQADFEFDPEFLQIVALHTDESFAEVFIEKDIDNNRGQFRLTGGLTSPGFSQPEGTFAQVYFQAIKPGKTSIQYLPSSRILLNDGDGSNTLSEVTDPFQISISASASAEIDQLPVTEILERHGEKLIFFSK